MNFVSEEVGGSAASKTLQIWNEGKNWPNTTRHAVRACLKSRMRGHVIVGVMTISTDVDKLYDTDLSDAAWALIAPMLPAARPGGRPRKINIRAVLNAIFYGSSLFCVDSLEWK